MHKDRAQSTSWLPDHESVSQNLLLTDEQQLWGGPHGQAASESTAAQWERGQSPLPWQTPKALMNAMCTKTERSPPAGCQTMRASPGLLLIHEQQVLAGPHGQAASEFTSGQRAEPAAQADNEGSDERNVHKDRAQSTSWLPGGPAKTCCSWMSRALGRPSWSGQVGLQLPRQTTKAVINAMCTKTERSPPAGCQTKRRSQNLLLMDEQQLREALMVRQQVSLQQDTGTEGRARYPGRQQRQ